MAKVSVIVPIYNVEPYLRQCLDSLVKQTFSDLEMILVDDGSTDGCGAICDEYATRDNRIQVIHQKNAGLAAADNCGLDHATGEWIAIVDSDDWLAPDYFQRLFELQGDSDADILFTNGCIAELPDGIQHKVKNFDTPFEASQGPEMEYLLARTQNLLGADHRMYHLWAYYWDKLFRRDMLERYNIRFTKSVAAKISAMDALFVCSAMVKAAKIKAVDYIGYHYRVRENSFTTVISYNRYAPNACIALFHEMEQSVTEYARENTLIYQANYARCISLMHTCMIRTFFHPDNPDDRKTVAAKIRTMKTDPFTREAIHYKSDKYLSKKILLLKHLLQLPWILPLEVIYKCRRSIKKVRAKFYEKWHISGA